MRTFLIAVCIVLYTFTPGFCQIVIELDDIPTEAGTTQTFYVLSNLQGIEVDVGAEGGNQNWDFSGYIFDETENDSLINPEEAPDFETYPEANRLLLTSEPIIGLREGMYYQYEILADSGWFMIGSVILDDGQGFGLNFPLDFSENPLVIAELPMEFEQEWDLSTGFSFSLPMNEDWGEEFAIFDSVLFAIEIGGYSEIDAWGTVTYTGGEVEALRQHTMIGGVFRVAGVREIFGQRLELDLFTFDLQVSHRYRWFTPGIGEIVSIISLPMEENPDFELAQKVRILRRVPEIEVANPNMDFGVVHQGNAGVAVLTVGNSGDGMAVIDSISFPENLIEEMECLSDIPVRVNPGEEENIRFLWLPLQDRDLAGEKIELFHNDPETYNPIIINLAGGTPSSAKKNEVIPSDITLNRIFPNPFNSTTTISYSIPDRSNITLNIYNTKGGIVDVLLNGVMPAGQHSVNWDANDYPAGLYFVQMESQNYSSIRKIVLVK